MSLLSLLLGEKNPVAQWAGEHSNTLTGIGTSLLSDGMNFAPAQQGAVMDRQAAAQRDADAKLTTQTNATKKWLAQNYPDLAQAVDAGLPVSEAWQEAFKRKNAKSEAPQNPYMSAGDGKFFNWQTGQYTSDPNAPPGGSSGSEPSSVQEYQFYADQETQAGRQPQSYADWRKGANSTVRAGVGQPIPLKNRKTGEYHTFQSMTDGTMVDTMTGKPANEQEWMYDPGMINSDRAAGTAVGTAQGGAQFSLPSAKANLDQELANIAALKADTKGKQETFGSVGPIPQQWLPTTPATDKFSYKQRVDQVVGENFLQAFQALKGAGAITEQEGAKAQAAMGRLSTSQKQEDFDQALTDLEAVLKKGYEVLQQKAGTSFSSSPAGGAPGGVDDLLTKYGQ